MPPVRLDESTFLAEVERIVNAAQLRGVPLRAVGGVGIYCRIRADPGARALYLRRYGPDHPGAPKFKDLDLASLEKFSAPIYKLLVKELHFTEDRETNALFGMYRNIYFHPEFQIDIFYDVLRFSHDIRLAGRFPPGVALSPEDLLLGKGQIHVITPPDLVDMASLLTAVPIESMDTTYLTKLLGDDWGLWYDFRANLEQGLQLLLGWVPDDQGLSPPVLGLARRRIREALQFVDRVPKSRKWVRRSAIGTREPWFEPVDEIR
jgi:hypothetical protein